MGAYEHPSLQALDQIEELLEAYGDARLAPPGPVLARMRRAVLEQAAATAAIQAAERARAEIAAAPRDRLSWIPRLRLPRPVFAAGFAAMLTMATGAAVLAAPPGSPFFNARVAIEQAFLPAVSDLDARLAAHEELLQTRLAEAQAAADRGDAEGLAAALAAYDTEVALAVEELGVDADRLAHLEAMLAKHVATLTALQAEVPSQASVDRALENSQKAIAKIKEKKAASGKPSNPGGDRPTPRQGVRPTADRRTAPAAGAGPRASPPALRSSPGGRRRPVAVADHHSPFACRHSPLAIADRNRFSADRPPPIATCRSPLADRHSSQCPRRKQDWQFKKERPNPARPGLERVPAAKHDWQSRMSARTPPIRRSSGCLAAKHDWQSRISAQPRPVRPWRGCLARES